MNYRFKEGPDAYDLPAGENVLANNEGDVKNAEPVADFAEGQNFSAPYENTTYTFDNQKIETSSPLETIENIEGLNVGSFEKD